MLRFEHQALGEIQQDEGKEEGRCAAPASATAQVRRLTASHLADIQQLLTGLDQPSRCARFGWAASDAALAAHAKNAIASARIIFGVFEDRQLRGVLEIYDGGAARPAEAALVVAAAWRRRGFGWALLQSAMQWAAEIDAGPMRLIFSRHNWPMRQLTAKADATLDIVLDEICAEITTGIPLARTPRARAIEMTIVGEHMADVSQAPALAAPSAQPREVSTLPPAAARTALPANILILKKPRPTGILARLLAALHHSRSLQAQQVLKAHRHLRAGSPESQQPTARTRGETVSIKRSSSRERAFRIPALGNTALLAVMAFAFLVFHVVVGTWANRALPDDPAAQRKASIASYGD